MKARRAGKLGASGVACLARSEQLLQGGRAWGV